MNDLDKPLDPKLKAYIDELQAKIIELKNFQVLHLSLRLAGITGRTTWRDDKPKPLPDHLGIAIYFIFGSPESPESAQEFGLAFGLSPEKYKALMASGSNEILIHEVKPENSRLKDGEQCPIEFLDRRNRGGT